MDVQMSETFTTANRHKQKNTFPWLKGKTTKLFKAVRENNSPTNADTPQFYQVSSATPKPWKPGVIHFKPQRKYLQLSIKLVRSRKLSFKIDGEGLEKQMGSKALSVLAPWQLPTAYQPSSRDPTLCSSLQRHPEQKWCTYIHAGTCPHNVNKSFKRYS